MDKEMRQARRKMLHEIREHHPEVTARNLAQKLVVVKNCDGGYTAWIKGESSWERPIPASASVTR
jgi:hypothetical protein